MLLKRVRIIEAKQCQAGVAGVKQAGTPLLFLFFPSTASVGVAMCKKRKLKRIIPSLGHGNFTEKSYNRTEREKGMETSLPKNRNMPLTALSALVANVHNESQRVLLGLSEGVHMLRHTRKRGRTRHLTPPYFGSLPHMRCWLCSFLLLMWMLLS